MTDKIRKQTAQQKLNNFLRSPISKQYPLTKLLKLVLHALASYCYYKDDCDPSLSSLMDYAEIKKSEHMSQQIYLLYQMGLIGIIKNNGKRNKYKWLVPEISDEEIYKSKPVNKSGKNRYKKKTTPC